MLRPPTQTLRQQSEEVPPCQLPWEEQKNKQTKVKKGRVEWVLKKGDELNSLGAKSKKSNKQRKRAKTKKRQKRDKLKGFSKRDKLNGLHANIKI